MIAAVFLATGGVAGADENAGAADRDAGARAAHEEALRLARAGEFAAAARASDAAVTAAPDWAEARFVRAGILTRIGRTSFDPQQPPRRGVDYARAAAVLSAAHDDLQHYLALRPWADNRAQVEVASKQLAELAASARSNAATIRAWDTHQYPVRGWVNCRAGAYTRFWFELGGRIVTSIPAGDHLLTLRTEDCGVEQRRVTMPLYEGGPEQYVDVSVVLQPPGPAQRRIDVALSPGIELVHAGELELLRESDGREVGARFDGGANLFGGHVTLTGRDRGGWRNRAGLQAELGYYRGTAQLVSYTPDGGESGIPTGAVTVSALRAGVGLRLQRVRHGMRAFVSAGIAGDRWTVHGGDASAVSMLRAPLAAGFDLTRSCTWRIGTRVQYAPALPVGSTSTFTTLDVSGTVTRAWCGSGRGITGAQITELTRRGAAARRAIFHVGVGFDQIYADDEFGLRRSLFTGEQFGAEFTGGATLVGPTFYMRTFEFGQTVRASVDVAAGYYAGTSHLVSYSPKPGSSGSSVGGLPRDVDVHAFQVSPAVNLRVPLVWASPFVALGIATESWNMSEGDNPAITAFRLPLTAGIEIIPSCAFRVRVHARYSPGVALGIQDDFTTTQLGAALAYARCVRK